jgi:hypothetical protein
LAPVKVVDLNQSLLISESIDLTDIGVPLDKSSKETGGFL